MKGKNLNTTTTTTMYCIVIYQFLTAPSYLNTKFAKQKRTPKANTNI